MYPLLMRMCTDSYEPFASFFSLKVADILKFVGLHKFDLLLPEKHGCILLDWFHDFIVAQDGGFVKRDGGMEKEKYPRRRSGVWNQSMISVPKYSGRWKSGFSVPTGFHIP